MVLRRTRHELDRAQRRLHLVDGFLLAMRDLDAVVATIRQAADGPDASQQLQVGALVSRAFCVPLREREREGGERMKGADGWAKGEGVALLCQGWSWFAFLCVSGLGVAASCPVLPLSGENVAVL